jgi:modification methylase
VTWYEIPQLPADPSHEPRPGVIPLVWPTGQHGVSLRDHGYVPATVRDHRRVPPATAAYAIDLLSPPGGVVVDPDCGAGTVVVEALRCGRHAVGIAHGRRWWALTRANLTAAKHHGAVTDGMVLPSTRAVDLTGTADLVLTAWRPTASLTSSDGEIRHTRLARMLACSRSLLKPGGHLVIVTRPQRRHGYLLNAPGGLLHRAARAAHLAPIARCIALTVPIRHGHLILTLGTAQRSGSHAGTDTATTDTATTAYATRRCGRSSSRRASAAARPSA